MPQEALLDRAVETALGLELAEVPEATIRHAGKVIADTVGVARAGGREPEVQRLIAMERAEELIDQSSPGGLATLLADTSRRVLPETAAYLNATGGSFLELDEGMRPTGHPGMQVIVPALAAAESVGSTGSLLLSAVLSGYEVAARLFTAFRLTPPTHPHGHFGGIGGAVAVALIQGIDPREAARVAATSPLLTAWDACYDGATARNTWMGSAAREALKASKLVEAGFTGSARAFETGFGQLASTLVDEAALTDPLDYEHLGIGRNYFKVHSACALTHAALDAAISMGRIEAEQVERVLVETVNNNLKLDRQAAPNALSARFSLQYSVAAGMMLGAVEPETFEYREDIARLAERVEVAIAPELEAKWPESSPARVSVVVAGETRSAEVENPYGHHLNPVSDRDLRAKFDRLVANDSISPGWWSRLTNLRDIDDCADVLEVR